MARFLALAAVLLLCCAGVAVQAASLRATAAARLAALRVKAGKASSTTASTAEMLSQAAARVEAGGPADELFQLLEQLGEHINAESKAADEAHKVAATACTAELDDTTQRVSSARDNVAQLKRSGQEKAAALASKKREVDAWLGKAAAASKAAAEAAASAKTESATWKASDAALAQQLSDFDEVISVVRELGDQVSGGVAASGDSSGATIALQLSSTCSRQLHCGAQVAALLQTAAQAATAVGGAVDKLPALLSKLAGQLEGSRGEVVAQREAAAEAHRAAAEKSRAARTAAEEARSNAAAQADELRSEAAALTAEAQRLAEARAAAVELLSEMETNELPAVTHKCSSMNDAHNSAQARRTAEARTLRALQTRVRARLAGALTDNAGVRAVADSVSASYAWAPAEWGACSAACGGGSQTRVLACHSFAGAAVNLTFCAEHAGRPPATQQECNSDACTWAVTDWSACSAACGGGTRTRAVSCAAQDGTAVTDEAAASKCVGAGPRPLSEQPCNAAACTWAAEEWSACSRACGGGSRTRAVTCKTAGGDVFDGAHGQCPGAGQAPPRQSACNQEACKWSVADWADCPGICGTAKQTRAVQCVTSTGQVVPLVADAPQDGAADSVDGVARAEECFLAGARPAAERTCTKPCAWRVGDWGDCSAICNGGKQQRALSCVQPDGAAWTGVGCPAAGETPAVERACNEAACHWQASGWGECSADCDGGEQTRAVACVGAHGPAAADLCVADERPEDKRACNTKLCKPGKLTLKSTGGDMDGETNVALASKGARVEATGFVATPEEHPPAGLIDGLYGNDNAWRGGDNQHNGKIFAIVHLAKPTTLRSAAFGRDNSGQFGDQWRGRYTLQYTTEEGVDLDSPDSKWRDLGQLTYTDSFPARPSLRHVYDFASPVQDVRAVRVIVSGPEMTLDELELY